MASLGYTDFSQDMSMNIAIPVITHVTNIEIMSGKRILYNSQPLLCKYGSLS